MLSHCIAYLHQVTSPQPPLWRGYYLFFLPLLSLL